MKKIAKMILELQDLQNQTINQIN